MTDLLLIRHGEATHNLEGRFEGVGETSLTSRGRRQVKALSHRLVAWVPPISRLYTSPLLRARQTAEPIAAELGMAPVVRDDLREIDFGEISGLTLESFRGSFPDLFARWHDKGDLTFHYPGGEQRRAFFHRVGQAIGEIVAAHTGEQVVVVGHGGTLRAGLAHLFPDRMGNWWAYALHNASLTHVRILPEAKDLVALNDCRHLDGLVDA